MSLQRNGRSTRTRFREFWEGFGRAWVDLFTSEDNSHCPIFFTKSTDSLAHERPSLQLYAFPPVTLLTQVLRRVREQRHKLTLIAPLWRNLPWVVGVIPAAESSPVADPLETGTPLDMVPRYGIHDMVSMARVMGPACVAARQEPFFLPERVLNTMAEARAPSTLWNWQFSRLGVKTAT